MTKPTRPRPLRWAARHVRRMRPVAQVCDLVAQAREVIAETRTLARPVQALVLAEALAATTGALVAALAVAGRLAGLDLAHTGPPWRTLAYCLPAGAVANVAHRARLLAAVRRWHGIAVRRLDERLGRDEAAGSDVDHVDVGDEDSDGRSPEQNQDNERS